MRNKGKKYLTAIVLSALLLTTGNLPAQTVRAAAKGNVPGAPTVKQTGGNENTGGLTSSQNFMLNAESVRLAAYGQDLNLHLSFVVRDPLTGYPASSSKKKVQSVYLQHNASDSFPFVLNMQEYPAYYVSSPSLEPSRFHNGGEALTYTVKFNNLTVRNDVKSQTYTVNLLINYIDEADPGKLQQEVLPVYINMQGQKAPKDARVLFRCVNDTVPKGTPGQWVPIKLDLANYGLDTVKILSVTLQMQGSPLIFNQVDQTAQVDAPLYPVGGRYYSEPNLNNGSMLEVDYGKFQISKQAAGGIQSVAFEVVYLDAMQVIKKETVSAYIEVLGGNGSQKLLPRVLISGYSTEPKKIMGGEPFALTLKLRNTSDMTAVNNMRLNISSHANGEKTAEPFLPTEGATAFFIKQIPAGKTLEYKLNLVSAATLTQKAYPLNVGLEYQDDGGNSYTTNEQVSLYVNQKARIDFGKFELQPDNAPVGSEISAFCNLINKGRVSLFNAEIKAPADAPFTMEPIYLGNIEAGATKAVDAALKTTQAFSGKSKFILSYEDESGNVSTLEHEFALNISDLPPMNENMANLPPGAPGAAGKHGPGNMHKSPSKIWVLLLIIVLLGLIGAGIGGVIYRKRRKQRHKRINIPGEDY